MANSRRKGIITLEEARERFNEYYNKRNPTSVGILRGKLFDATYQKKPKFVLKPGTPGSEKYMLEEGPRTFDMEGVDYFPEGETFYIEGDGKRVRGVSKGATYYKASDGEIDDLKSPDREGRRKSKKIYGPRTRKNELYSKRFKKDMKNRLGEFGDLGAAEKNLVDIYWEQYKKGGISRKNKKGSHIYKSKKDDDLFEFDTSDDERLEAKFRGKYAVNVKNNKLYEWDLANKKYKYIDVMTLDGNTTRIDIDFLHHILEYYLKEVLTYNEDGEIFRKTGFLGRYNMF